MSWSHYCELLSISDPDKQSFYEKESINSGWSVRELKRQMESSLFERLLLSRGDANKEQVLLIQSQPQKSRQFFLNWRDTYLIQSTFWKIVS